MNLLTTFADGGETLIIGRSDGDDGATEAIELTKERYSFTRQVEFIPAVDGRHTVNVRIRDDFGNVTSLEKHVYSFTNMPPKVKVVHYAQRINYEMVAHFVDFSKSFDKDSTWGGYIDSLFTLCENPEIGADPIPEAVKVSDYNPDGSPFVHFSKYIVRNALYDGVEGHYADIYAWVKDNEGMPSDTVHISIGHVESSVARQEYEGK
jgi:hypothetical protein